MNMLATAEAADLAAAQRNGSLCDCEVAIYTSGERDPRNRPRSDTGARQLHLMGTIRGCHACRIARPCSNSSTRFGPAAHLLQSARLAQKNGASEKIVLACLIHDIGNIGFIRADHGYWAAQLISLTLMRKSLSLWLSPGPQVLCRRVAPAIRTRSRTSAFSATTSSRAVLGARVPIRAQAQILRGGAAPHRERSLRCSIRTCRSSSRNSRISWAGISASRKKGSASTTALPPTCGARSTGRRGTCSASLAGLYIRAQEVPLPPVRDTISSAARTPSPPPEMRARRPAARAVFGAHLVRLCAPVAADAAIPSKACRSSRAVSALFRARRSRPHR